MARMRGDAKPTAGLPHPPSLVEAATRWTESLDAWQLVALHSICSQSKSFLVGFGMLDSMVPTIQGDGTHHQQQHPVPPFGDIASASEASRVEEEFQISMWGLVEGGHDYDRLNCSIQLHSAHLFAKAILLENL